MAASIFGMHDWLPRAHGRPVLVKPAWSACAGVIETGDLDVFFVCPPYPHVDDVSSC